MENKLVFTVDEFCAAHGICRAHFYNILKRGQGPRILKAGGRTLITFQAARDWRKEREQPLNTGSLFRNGASIPQHRLITKAEWDRLRKNEISKWTYHATTGDWQRRSVVLDETVVTKKDAP